MHQILSYIKFLFKSTNQHGVHSPFVYDLVTKCFYDRKNYPQYKSLKHFRSVLLQNREIINITDFGSGSKVFTSNKRAIKAIAKTSGTSLKNSKLLFRLARYFQASSILELGTNLGIGTYGLALGNPESKVTTIEGCQELLTVAEKQFDNNKIANIRTIHGRFTEQLFKIRQDRWDLVFFDGHHSKEATLNYFELLVPSAHNESLFIFDDIYWSQDMTDAWHIIKSHEKVTVTVDIFDWGLVFFRKEQAKEHFRIRV